MTLINNSPKARLKPRFKFLRPFNFTSANITDYYYFYVLCDCWYSATRGSLKVIFSLLVSKWAKCERYHSISTYLTKALSSITASDTLQIQMVGPAPLHTFDRKQHLTYHPQALLHPASYLNAFSVLRMERRKKKSVTAPSLKVWDPHVQIAFNFWSKTRTN